MTLPYPYHLLPRVFVGAVLLLCLIVLVSMGAMVKAMLFDAPPTRDRDEP